MEVLLMLVGAAALSAPILAWIALQRSARVDALARRLHELERELDRLRLERLPSAPPRGQLPEVREAREPAPEPPAPRTSQEPPPAAQQTPPRWPPPLEPTVEPTPEPAPEPARDPSSPRDASAPDHAQRGVDWERWLGVRGAAWAGGILFALAGVFLFRYAVEHGQLTPLVRVGLGAGAGLALLVGSEWLLRRRYLPSAGATGGAGIVALYASSWAATRLYELLPNALGFALLAGITALGCALATHQRQQGLAVLALIGGFLVPLLIRLDLPGGLGFFGYALFLDLGLLALARRMRWPMLAALGVLGTSVIELFWIGARLEPGAVWIALLSMAVLALVFLSAYARLERHAGARLAQGAAALFPLLFALRFASDVGLGLELGALCAFGLVLNAGACWSGLRERDGWLPLASSAAASALLLTWTLARGPGQIDAWALVGACAAFALLPNAFAAFGRRARGGSAPGSDPLAAACALAAGVGLLTLLLAHSPFGAEAEFALRARESAAWASPWPWFSGAALLAALLLGVLRDAQLAWLAFFAGLGAGALVARWTALHALAPGRASALVAASLVLALGLRSLALAWTPVGSRARRHGTDAALACTWMLQLGLGAGFARAGADWPWQALLGSAALMLVGLLGCAPSGLALFGNAVAFLHAIMVLQVGAQTAGLGGGSAFELALLALVWIAMAAHALHPFAFAQRWGAAPAAARWAACAPLVLLPSFASEWFTRWAASGEWGSARGARFSDAAFWLVAAAAWLPAAALAWRARASADAGSDEERGERARTGLAWSGALLALLACGGVHALQRGPTLPIHAAGWAACAAGLALASRRRALLLLAAGAGALAVALIWYSATFDSPYTYADSRAWLAWIELALLVPAAACALASALAARGERAALAAGARAGHWPGAVLGLCAVLLVFMWIHLRVVAHFDPPARLTYFGPRFARRDLALSIAWAVYALALLALGLWRSSREPRWISLGLLVLSLFKLFLRDLGQLDGLYRVGALVGLGASLLAVSVLYQRFVFRPQRSP